MNKGVFLTISGRVQGVGFRYFTRTNAKEMALTGWVRNLPDGKVEVLAFGPENELEQFMLV
jgi:acylphosphatase